MIDRIFYVNPLNHVLGVVQVESNAYKKKVEIDLFRLLFMIIMSELNCHFTCHLQPNPDKLESLVNETKKIHIEAKLKAKGLSSGTGTPTGSRPGNIFSYRSCFSCLTISCIGFTIVVGFDNLRLPHRNDAKIATSGHFGL